MGIDVSIQLFYCVNDHNIMMWLPIAIRQKHHILKEHHSSMPLWSEL